MTIGDFFVLQADFSCTGVSQEVVYYLIVTGRQAVVNLLVESRQESKVLQADFLGYLPAGRFRDVLSDFDVTFDQPPVAALSTGFYGQEMQRVVDLVKENCAA